MSLAPELAAFIGRPVKPSVTPTRVEGYAGHLRADRPTAATEQETTMPTGVYPRKKKAQKPSVSGLSKTERRARLEAVTAKRPAENVKAPKMKTVKIATVKASKTDLKILRKTASSIGPRFGVFEDGTVELRLASCTGIIAPTEAREFLAFLKRIGVE